MTLTLRLSNSGLSLATRPSSVVQTGVKSLGCEKSTRPAVALPLVEVDRALGGVGGEVGGVVAQADGHVARSLVHAMDLRGGQRSENPDPFGQVCCVLLRGGARRPVSIRGPGVIRIGDRSVLSSEMFLALKEMRRAKVRFGLLIVAIGLLVFLILFQQSLQNGLLRAFVGAFRDPSRRRCSSTRPTASGRCRAASSRRTSRQLARSADGVGAAGRIGQGTFTVTRRRRDRRRRRSSATRPRASARPRDAHRGPPARRPPARPSPAPRTPATGFDIGDIVTVEPGGCRADRRRPGRRRPAQRRPDAVRHLRRPTSPPSRPRNPDAGDAAARTRSASRPRTAPRRASWWRRSTPPSDDLDALTRDAGRRRGARRRPGAPVVPGDLPALRAGRAVRDRPVLPDHHVPEGRVRSRCCGPSGRPAAGSSSALLVQVRGHRRPRPRRRHRPVRAAHARSRRRPSALRFETGAVVVLVGAAAGARRCSARCSRPVGCWRSTRRGHDRGGSCDEARPARAAPAAGALRHRDRHPDAHRRAADVPRRPARRADPQLDRRRAGPGRRPHRVLVDGAVVVPAQPHRRRHAGRGRRRCPASPRPAGIGVVQLGARVPGNGPRDLARRRCSATSWRPPACPTPPAPGEVYADDVAARRRASRRAWTILLGPARTPVTVDRLRRPTCSTPGRARCGPTPDTWRDVLTANRPDAAARRRRLPGARRAGDRRRRRRRARRRRSTRATGGATESLTITEAVDAIPGVEQQRSTFNQIIGVTDRHRHRRGRPVLRPAHRRAHRRSTACSRRSAPAVARCSPALVAPGGRRHRRRRRRRRRSRRCSLDARHPARLDPVRHLAPPDRHQRRAAARRRRRRLRLLPPPGPARRPGLRHRNASCMHRSPLRQLARTSARSTRSATTRSSPSTTPTSRRRRRDRRARRPVRLGQDDPVLDRRRPPHADVRHGRRRRRGHLRLLVQAAHRVPPQKVGFVFQAVNLVPFLTARENLLVVDELGRRTGAPARRAGRRAARGARPRRPGRRTCRPSSRADSASGSRSAGR